MVWRLPSLEVYAARVLCAQILGVWPLQVYVEYGYLEGIGNLSLFVIAVDDANKLLAEINLNRIILKALL